MGATLYDGSRSFSATSDVSKYFPISSGGDADTNRPHMPADPNGPSQRRARPVVVADDDESRPSRAGSVASWSG